MSRLVRRRLVRAVVVAALVLAWAIELRPAALGGPLSFVIVSGTSMEPRMSSGDLVVVRERSDYQIGDVVAFRLPEDHGGGNAKVIHRITGGSARSGFTVQGDNRNSQDLWRPRPDQILGEEWLRLPGAGSVLVALRSSPFALAAASGATAFLLMLLWPKRTRDEPDLPPQPAPAADA
jgi:signal peptidase I